MGLGLPANGRLRTVEPVQSQLGLEGVPDKLVRVTPARLATWASCPRKYRMTYVDKPTPSRGGPWAHNTLGAVVHNALRAFFELRAEQRTPEKAAALVWRHWKNDGFADRDHASEYRERAQRWVSDYVRNLDERANPIALEQWVSASIGTIIAEGRVDRIDQRPDGELVVIDYKTGRRAPRENDARDSLALALYALASRKTLRRPCRRVELHHLPTGATLACEHEQETLDRHRERAEELAVQSRAASEQTTAGVNVDQAFPPRTGPHCSSCDFRAHCPEGRRAAPDVPSWALLKE